LSWDVLLPYAVFVITLLGVASLARIEILMLAGGCVMVYAFGVLLVKWLEEVGGAELKARERIPLAIVSGVVMIALIGSLSSVLWPGKVLFLTRILLGLTGTLLCATVLLKRARAPRMDSRGTVAQSSVSIKPRTMLAALGLLLLIGSVVFLAGSREGAERYTELFFVGSETRSCSYAQVSGDGSCIDVRVGVVNKENQSIEYNLVLETPIGTGTLNPFTLNDGEAYETSFELPARACEQGGDVTVLLYDKGHSLLHRSIRLSCALLFRDHATAD
jgi:uncharacterized membrane protein